MSLEDKVFFFILCCLNPVLSMLRGTDSFSSVIGCKRCSREDLAIVLIYLFIILIITFINKRRLSKRNKKIKKSNKQIKFTSSNINKLLISLFLIGFVGSFLSAGIAVMFTLALVFLDLSPFIASPTALLLSCMTSGSATLLYFLNGQIDLLGGLVGGIVILMFTIGTRLTVYKRMMSMGRESILVLFIIILITISIPINVYKVLPEILEDKRNGKNIWEFESVCPKDG